jgi:ubiquinone/menaquinone biosynthesis C-methylase UbiE
METNKQKINYESWRTEEMVNAYSTYILTRNEIYLFKKYFASGSAILDLACGLGRTTLRLHEMGYAVKGIDLSDAFIEIAKKRFPAIPFALGSFCDINEKDDSYDSILISYNGLDYAYPEAEREKALNECYRVMRHGGYLIMSTHNIKSFLGAKCYIRGRGNIKFWLKNICSGFRENNYIFDTGRWTFYASPEYVIKQFESRGFSFEEMKGYNKPDYNNFQSKYFCPWIDYVFKKN